MGIPTITATRILKGQMEGHLGPETPLTMDTFPYVALSKVLKPINGPSARARHPAFPGRFPLSWLGLPPSPFS